MLVHRRPLRMDTYKGLQKCFLPAMYHKLRGTFRDRGKMHDYSMKVMVDDSGLYLSVSTRKYAM